MSNELNFLLIKNLDPSGTHFYRQHTNDYSMHVRSSLVGQTFTEKECLVIMDRFPWHRGIQNVMSWAMVTRNIFTVSIQPLYDVGDQ